MNLNNAGLHRSLALCDFDDLIANNLMKREAALASISDANSRSPVFVLFLRHTTTHQLSLPRSRVVVSSLSTHSHHRKQDYRRTSTLSPCHRFKGSSPPDPTSNNWENNHAAEITRRKKSPLPAATATTTTIVAIKTHSTTLLNQGIKQTSKCHFKTEDHSIKCPLRRGGDGASVAFLSNVAIASLLEEEEDFCDTIYSRQYHSIRTCL